MFQLEKFVDILEKYGKDDDYETQFKENKLLFYLSIGANFLIVIFYLTHWHELKPNPFRTLAPFFKAHHVQAVIAIVLGFVGTQILPCHLHLRRLYKMMLRKPAIHRAATTLANVSDCGLRKPKFSYFLISVSLKDFERKVIRTYEALRKDAIKRKHHELALQELQARKQTIEEMQKQVPIILEAVPENERDRYRRRFNAAPDLKEVRAIIEEIETKSQARNASGSSQIAKRDSFRKMLADLSCDGTCPEAAALIRNSEQTPYVKEAISFLKQAITAQKKFNKCRDAIQDSFASTQSASEQSADSESRTLAELFPTDVDQEMAAHIITALAQESPDQHQELRLRTANVYRTALKKSFPARSFDETLGWLVEQ